MNIDLSGKWALVTGATGQLGRVMVKTLASCGANIVVHYNKDEAGAASIAKDIESLGMKAKIISCDITKLHEVLHMQQELKSYGITPDIVVTNAVIQYSWKKILDQDIEDYVSQFESCVLHNVNMAKAFIPHMEDKGDGRFIGINTECAMQNFPTQSAYVAGKRGMDGILRVLAKEVGSSGITVNQVAPGWTISQREREGGIIDSPEYTGKVPLKRRGTDQEIANVVAFLASDLASYITGAYIPVCGGNVMPGI